MCGSARLMRCLMLLALVLGGCKGEPEPAKAPKAQGPEAPAPASPASQPGTPAAGPVTIAPAPLKMTPTPTFDPSSEQTAPGFLEGTWVADGSDAPLGTMRVTLAFKTDAANVKTLTWSEEPLLGSTRSKTAPYEVRGRSIQSKAILGDNSNSVQYQFKGDKLELEYYYGRKVLFRRVKG